MRAELGLEAERGKRYSFGYSACPDLADQLKLFRLLEPERAIGVTLTERVPARARGQHLARSSSTTPGRCTIW